MTDQWRKILKKFHPEGIPSFGSGIYNLISGRSNIFQLHYKLVAEDIKQYCQKGKLLDIGTGPGWLLPVIHNILPDLRLTGIDISPSMIKKAKRNVRGIQNGQEIEFMVGNVSDLPFPDNSMDCIVSTGSIHHWKETDNGLAEIYRVLKDNSCALLYDLVQKLPDSIRRQTVAEFGRYRMILFWLHSFEEPFLSPEEMEMLPVSSPFLKGTIHFTGALCCLVLKKGS